MEYELVITKFYIERGFNRLFDVKRKDGISINLSTDLIGTIATVSIDKIPSFLESVIAERSIQVAEYTYIHFGEFTEDGIIEVPDDQVGIFLMDVKSLVSKTIFFELVLVMAKKSLEADAFVELIKSGLVDEEWMENIKRAIPELQTKLDLTRKKLGM